MPIDRFFSEATFDENSELTLEEQEFHHLSRVTRTREGEEVELVNGKGQLGEAMVVRIEKKKAVLKIQKLIQAPPAPFKLILVQAIPRINRLDMIIEKGTELGMDELWLFPGARSEKKQFLENQLNRLTTITMSAMKQCGRLFLPSISLHPPLSQWKSFPSPCYFGDISSDAPTIFSEWQRSPPLKELYFFIGPESGFSEEEIAIFKNNQVKGVFMNENVLRTDTAAITAMAVVGAARLA